MLADGSIDIVVAHAWLLQRLDDIGFVFQKLDGLSLDCQIIANRFHLLFVNHEPGTQLALTCEHFPVVICQGPCLLTNPIALLMMRMMGT